MIFLSMCVTMRLMRKLGKKYLSEEKLEVNYILFIPNHNY